MTIRDHLARGLCVLMITASLLALTGCLEQLQSTRAPEGAANNFFLHLHAGELDDARAYFAPGLVTPSPQLDESIKDASRRLRAYNISRGEPRVEELGNGQVRVTLLGQVQPGSESSTTPQPTPGTATVDILSVLLVERGPGWRILEFSVLCCPEQR